MNAARPIRQARLRSWDEAFISSKKGPFTLALLFHMSLFVWNPIIMKSDLKPQEEFLQVKYQDAMPVIPKPEVKKPEVKKKEVAKKAKKSGLTVTQKPKPMTITKKVAPPQPKPFISKISIPKFVPRTSEDIIAASPTPGLSVPARQKMVQAPVAPLKGKSRGIRAADINFKLEDKGTLIPGGRLVAIPIGQERGETPYLPAATMLKEAPKGIRTVQGYRSKPGDGSGSGDLVGKNKNGYFGVSKAPIMVEGEMSGASGKGSKVVSGQGFEIGGPIGDRKILARRLPEYPDWAEEKGISAIVQIFFTVRPDGSIRTNMRVDRSSGYPELDQLAKEALLKWRFSATRSASDEQTAWGVITFRFTLA